MSSYSSFMPLDNEPDDTKGNGHTQHQSYPATAPTGPGYGAVQQPQTHSGRFDSNGTSSGGHLTHDPPHLGYAQYPVACSSNSLGIHGTQVGFVPSLRDGEGRDLYNPPSHGQTTSDQDGANNFPVGSQAQGSRPQDPQWDFNSNEPMPGIHNSLVQAPRFQVREFSRCNDENLLSYLAMRKVSTGFLVEIDQFIRAHPELVNHTSGARFLKELTTLPPLEAYQYFLRGYTRPARYIDGIMLTGEFRLQADFRPKSVSQVRDTELEDFFDGFEYRYDILDQIDRVVSAACVDLAYGRFVNSGLRRLVCYAAWGNPVDAYKWYEYSYQQDYMPHRYLPEHVILGEIPKPDEYSEPKPTMVRGWRSHRFVRFRMAKAKDEGVDVIDVLLSEYRTALARKGYRRIDIDSMCAAAKLRLDDERRFPRGVDIVDMIMDDTVDRLSTKRSVGFHSAAARPVARPSRVRASIPVQSRGSRGARRRKVGNTTGVAAYLRTQASELRGAKAVLDRLYSQEAQAYSNPYNYNQGLKAIASSRATAERRYVNVLIRYLRNADRMSTSQASELQRCFTRGRMAMAGTGSNRDYLFAMYPYELE